MASSRGKFNRADAERVVRNALIFSAPALIVFFTQIQTGASIEEAAGAIQVWVLGVVIDVLRKVQAGK